MTLPLSNHSEIFSSMLYNLFPLCFPIKGICIGMFFLQDSFHFSVLSNLITRPSNAFLIFVIRSLLSSIYSLTTTEFPPLCLHHPFVIILIIIVFPTYLITYLSQFVKLLQLCLMIPTFLPCVALALMLGKPLYIVWTFCCCSHFNITDFFFLWCLDIMGKRTCD